MAASSEIIFLRVVEPVQRAGGFPMSDEALFARAAGGDRKAFELVVERHEVAIRRLCRSLLADPSLADEVAQETFLQLWQVRKRYASVTSVRALLYTMTRNRCRSLLRRRAVLHFVGLDTPDDVRESSSAVGADDMLGNRQVAEAVDRALRSLPEKFRTPLVLRFVDGLEYEEIATVLGRTPSTARSRVHYGLKALAKKLPPELRPWNA